MIVVAQRYGRLGNRLALFAHLIGSARAHGLRIRNPAFREYGNLFRGTCQDPWCRYPAELSRWPKGNWFRWLLYYAGAKSWVPLMRHGSFPGWFLVEDIPGRIVDLSDPAFVERARSQTVVCTGYLLRDAENTARHAASIRGYFTPVSSIQRRVVAREQSHRADCDVLIGVHMRQGNYRRFEGGRYYYPTPVYTRWMQSLADALSGRRCGFLICSNEVHTASEFGDLRVFLDNADAPGDLYTLARCDYLLGPPSSFSRWASYYGQVPLLSLECALQEIDLDGFEVIRSP